MVPMRLTFRKKKNTSHIYLKLQHNLKVEPIHGSQSRNFSESSGLKSGWKQSSKSKGFFLIVFSTIFRGTKRQ